MVGTRGQQIQGYELSMQGIEVLATLLGLKQGRLRPNEDAYWAYCRGVERLYLEVFVNSFYQALEKRSERC
jgi:hypothetical protein